MATRFVSSRPGKPRTMEQIPSRGAVGTRSQGAVEPGGAGGACQYIATIDAQIAVLYWTIKGADPRYPTRITDRWAEIDRLLEERIVVARRGTRRS